MAFSKAEGAFLNFEKEYFGDLPFTSNFKCDSIYKLAYLSFEKNGVLNGNKVLSSLRSSSFYLLKISLSSSDFYGFSTLFKLSTVKFVSLLDTIFLPSVPKDVTFMFVGDFPVKDY